MFEFVVKDPEEAARWLAFVRVCIDKNYSQTWFFRNMRSAWDLAQDVRFCSLENNLYSIQFKCLGHWERVMRRGAWNFRGNPVLIAPYDGFTKPSLVDLNHFDIWMQIHNLPDGYYPLIKNLASKAGEYMDVRKLIKNHVSIVRVGKREIFLVKYERLPD